MLLSGSAGQVQPVAPSYELSYKNATPKAGPVTGSGDGLDTELSQGFASPQSGEVDFTVTRPAAGAKKALKFVVQTTASFDEPLKQALRGPQPYSRRIIGPTQGISSPGTSSATVTQTIRTTGHNHSALPIVPIAGTYRFAPGQTSMTIPVRMNPNFVPVSAILLSVDAIVPPHGIYDVTFPAALTIMPSPDQIPPQIVSSSVSPQAVTLTFSKPMNPATVENVKNYWVSVSASDGSVQPVTLKSAAYDPATHTATLTPTAPLHPANHVAFYDQIRPASSLPTDPPQPQWGLMKPQTDLHGNPLPGEGPVLFVDVS
jgi:Bacterial Ig-like domain